MSEPKLTFEFQEEKDNGVKLEDLSALATVKIKRVKVTSPYIGQEVEYVLVSEYEIAVAALKRIKESCTGPHLFNADCDGCHRTEIAEAALKELVEL